MDVTLNHVTGSTGFPNASQAALRAAYDHLVVANPLPSPNKRRFLEEWLGGPHRLDDALAWAGVAWDRSTTPLSRPLSQEERLYMRVLDDVVLARPGADGAARRLRHVMGHRFDAWVDVAAFAAQARVLLTGVGGDSA